MIDETHTTHDEHGSYVIVKDALLRDVETVVRECEKLAGHRLMQVAGPARRFLNLLRPHIEGGAK